jgi:hypothetical protein
MQAWKNSLAFLAWLGGVGFAASSCSGEGEVEIGGDVVEVVPVREMFEPCNADVECPLSTECWEITVDYGDVVVTDAMCTHDCFDDFDCPSDAVCADANGVPLCYQLCFDDFDCWEGFACIEDFTGSGFAPMCMPF